MEKGGVLKTSFIHSGLGMIRFMSPDTESNIWAMNYFIKSENIMVSKRVGGCVCEPQ